MHIGYLFKTVFYMDCVKTYGADTVRESMRAEEREVRGAAGGDAAGADPGKGLSSQFLLVLRQFFHL